MEYSQKSCFWTCFFLGRGKLRWHLPICVHLVLLMAARTICDLRGYQKKFYVDGTVMEESTYISGKIDGVARWYDQEGNLTIEYEYNMGELVSQ